MTGEGESERSLAFVPGQAHRRIEHTLQGISLWQIVWPVAGQFTSDPQELVAIGQGVFDDDEELFQFDGDLDDRGQHHDEGSLLLAGDELCEGGLDHFGIAEEPVKIVQEEDGGPVVIRQSGKGTQSGKRIAGTRLGGLGVGISGQTESGGNVPHGDFPFLAVGVLDDFAFGLVGFVRLHPEPGERGMDVIGDLIGQFHGFSFRGSPNKKPQEMVISWGSCRALVDKGYFCSTCWSAMTPR